jgi:hypothetical protein
MTLERVSSMSTKAAVTSHVLHFKVSHAVACTGVISGILALNLADPAGRGF